MAFTVPLVDIPIPPRVVAGFFLLFTLAFGALALQDFAELLPAPTQEVTRNIAFVRSQANVGTRYITTHYNTVYLKGGGAGYLMPNHVFTAPDLKELSAARKAAITYRAEKIACPTGRVNEGVWDADEKSMQHLTTDNAAQHYAFSGECYPILAISLDGRETFTLWDFRVQTLLIGLGKLLLALIVPAAIWMVRVIPPGPDKPQKLSPLNEAWEKQKQKDLNMSQEDFM